MKRIALASALSILLLSACGYSQGDRALSGAAIGGAGGAAAGALMGNPAAGALVGGAAGAATGAFTSPDTINLGRPLWR